jgi:uncharacterized protein YjbI with pentapeptide repeats
MSPVFKSAALALTLACVSLPSLGTHPASATDLTIDSATYQSGPTKIGLVGIEIRGASLSEADLKALFAQQDAAKAADLIGRLDAGSIRIAKVLSETVDGEQRFTMVTDDLELSGISVGKVVSGRATGGRIEGRSDKGGTVSGSFGRVTLSDADLALALRIQAPSKDVSGPLRPLYAEFAVDEIKLSLNPTAQMTIDRVVARDVRARPVEEPFQTVAQQGLDVNTMTPQQRARVIKALAGAYASNAVGLFEAQGIAVSDRTNPLEGFTIARIRYTGAVGTPASFAIEQIAFAGPGAKGRIGSIAFAGWSLEPFMKTLVLAYGDPASAHDPVPTDLIPALGSVELRDLSVEQAGAFPANSGVQSVVLAFDNPNGGVPKGLRFAVDRLTGPVKPTDEGTGKLLDMGYHDIDLSGGIDLALQETGDLQLRDASFRGANMGALRVTGLLGNAAPVLNARNSAAAMMASTAVTGKRLSISVENRGLFERAIESQAREKKTTPDQVRKELAGAAALGLPGMLGTSPQAKSITATVMRFLAKPERMTIALSAKDPAGFGIADYVAVSSPDDLFKSIDVTATND